MNRRTAAVAIAAVLMIPSLALAQGPEAPSGLDDAVPGAATDPDAAAVADGAAVAGGAAVADGAAVLSGAADEATADAEPATESDTGAASDAEADEGATDDPSDGYAEDGEDYPEIEFCGGGGEESQVDLAYYEMEEGRLRRARRMLVTALREGAVDEWQRGYALATLAEVQLRLRTYGQAIVNYRKALRVDPDGVTETARVGLATALYLRGSSAAADREARTARDALCADPYTIAGCYGATAILARTATDPNEQREATDALAQLRSARADLAQSFDQMERRLDRRRPRNRR